MIYRSFTYTVLILLIVSACTGKTNRQTEEVPPEIPQQEVVLIPIPPADNFLCGNGYLIGSEFNGHNRPVGNQWKLRNLKTFAKDRSIYGTAIIFQDSIHYHIYYTAPCGNDCFFNSYGKYQLFIDDKLILTEDSARLYGDCFGIDSINYTNIKQLFQITYPEGDIINLQFDKIETQ